MALVGTLVHHLLVVAHNLQHFVEGVEAVADYIRIMDMELNRRKCAMATTEGVPGLQARLCPKPEKPTALGTSSGLRPLPGTPAAGGWGVLPAAQTPAAPDGGAPLVPQHPRATESGAGRHPGDPRGSDTIRRPLHRRRLRHRAPPGRHRGLGREGNGAVRFQRLAGQRKPPMKKGISANKDWKPSGRTRTVPGKPCSRSTRDIIRNRGAKIAWPPHTPSAVFLNVRSWTLERCL